MEIPTALAPQSLRHAYPAPERDVPKRPLVELDVLLVPAPEHVDDLQGLRGVPLGVLRRDHVLQRLGRDSYVFF